MLLPGTTGGSGEGRCEARLLLHVLFQEMVRASAGKRGWVFSKVIIPTHTIHVSIDICMYMYVYMYINVCICTYVFVCV